MYELYLACDYSAFARNYAEKYCRFVDFLKRKGLANNVGESDAFFSHLDSLPYYDWLADEEIIKYKKSIAPRSFLGEVFQRLFRSPRRDVRRGA